ncbi:GNAT family N-acetyltransferase [Vibrio gazogenes]|uniref:Protein ElaA n=1 Tax=Vibrio gazogenes TaxID=687 RepID=A0A1Z2SJ00_VIBGA|nr:GNAT family N-acetyltransferase [Vibrio gazogenes]ASA57163.1 GNAT family N-acetyltransferase [Vibrio gazogenes]
MITWHLLSFPELTTTQLYQLIKLRIDVFVVEQTCPYPELDDKDHMPGVHHLLGYQDEKLVACARLMPAGISYPGSSIGRIATHTCVRGEGVGHQLLTYAIEQCVHLWPETPIEIGAQTQLETFYRQYGFVPTSEPYLEDGISHIDMKRISQ